MELRGLPAAPGIAIGPVWRYRRGEARGIPLPDVRAAADRVRAWLRNLEADPRLTFHLKAIVQADLAATARIITEPAERREILEKVARVWRRDPEEMIADSPLIEVSIEGHSADRAA